MTHAADCEMWMLWHTAAWHSTQWPMRLQRAYNKVWHKSGWTGFYMHTSWVVEIYCNNYLLINLHWSCEVQNVTSRSRDGAAQQTKDWLIYRMTNILHYCMTAWANIFRYIIFIYWLINENFKKAKSKKGKHPSAMLWVLRLHSLPSRGHYSPQLIHNKTSLFLFCTILVWNCKKLHIINVREICLCA